MQLCLAKRPARGLECQRRESLASPGKQAKANFESWALQPTHSLKWAKKYLEGARTCSVWHSEQDVWRPSVFWRHWWQVIPLTLSYTRLPLAS